MLSRRLPIVLLALCLASGCARKSDGPPQAAGLRLPPYYDDAAIARASALTDSGYTFLEQGKTAEAIDAFTRQREVLPGGRWSAYNLACATSRAGDVESGIGWIGKAVEGGWDDIEPLKSDPDLAALRADPRFAGILERALALRSEHEAPFAQGLPEFDVSPVPVTDRTALAAWADSVEKGLRRQAANWYPWQTIAARMDFQGRRFAALRELNKGDASFSERRERMRAIARLKAPYEHWGALSVGVRKEVDAYLATNPSPNGKSEAYYIAGIAAFCEHNPQGPSDPNWAQAANAAKEQFAQVGAGSPFEGPAAAWRVRIDLLAAGENTDPVLPEVREFVRSYRASPGAMEVASSMFQRNVIESLWPIALDAEDIDGKRVSLDQYKGKVLLIDFWATWCGPCRGELPHLTAAYKTFHDRGLEIVSVSLDHPDQMSLDDYRRWITEKGMTWRHVYEGEQEQRALTRAYLVSGIPHPFLVGRDGRLLAMGDECRGEELAKSIEKALSGGTS